MKKLLCAFVAFLVLVLFLVSIASAESKEEGERLTHEADQLLENAKSLNDTQAALDKYNRAASIFEKADYSQGLGRTLNGMGTVYFNLGEYPKAVECFENALKIEKQVGNLAGEGKSLHNLGDVYREWGQYSTAVALYERALDVRKRVGDAKGEGLTLNNIGLTCWLWGRFDPAMEYYGAALELRRKIGDIKGEGHTLNNIGLVCWNWGQYARAVGYYERALDVENKIGDLRCVANILNNLGIIYYHWGRYAKALEYYERAQEVRGKIGDMRGLTLVNMGNVYRDWGQYPKALEYYGMALAKYQRLGDVRGEAHLLNNIGNIYATQGQYAEALSNFQKGIELSRAIGVPTRWGTDNIGNLYLDVGEVQKAEASIRQAGFWASLGRLDLVKRDYPSAKQHYSDLLESALQNRSAGNLFTAHTGLGLALEGMGDNREAANNFRKAIDCTEELRAGLNAAERMEFYNVRTGGFYRTAPYDGLARVLIKLNRPLEALRESEFTKARVFAEGLSKRAEGSAPRIPMDIFDTDSQLNEQLAELSKALRKAYEKDDKESIGVLEPQIKEAKDKLGAHVEMLRRDYPLFAATKYPQPMSLEQTALRNDEWVLSYHVTDSGIIIYLTRGRHLVKALFKPIAAGEIDGLVRDFREPLEIGQKDSPETKLGSFNFIAAKTLTDLLLTDILSELPNGTPVIIIPDGCLGMLPLEMLPLNDKGTIKTDKDIPYVSDAEFFGDRNLISYYQSITALTLARIHANQRTKEAGLLVMADPVFLENDKRMPPEPQKSAPTGVLSSLFKQLNLMAAENSEQIGGLYFSRLKLTSDLAKALSEIQKGTKVYTGLEATKSNFLDNIGPSLHRYDKIVFATHGYFGKDLPGIMEPVLVLTLVPSGIDGYLRMTEVLGLNMNAEIVALTACQTGIGKMVPGEGAMGMGRAFQYAGARSVLMSLWSVSELTSVHLVRDFFQHLMEGKSKLEALALARNKVRNEGYNHPFFWAPFILVGEAN